LRMLSLFGKQAGMFLENARLHARERDVAVLEERNRLARELHDSVTQVLFSLTLNLEAAGGLIEKKPDKASALVTRSGEMAAEALAEMRSLIFELRPAALQEKGLAMALTNHVNLFRRRQNIEVTLTLEGEDRLPPDVEFCLYRVAQEALTNAAKHARAHHVSLCYSVQPGLATLVVQDDGVGFDPAAAGSGQSFGMIGMNERLASVGGTLQVGSEPGRGTRIEARIPLQQPSAPSTSQEVAPK
ncbi:MAG TPA: sensor histidine kinase, partial [Symbiobacteriaceae bacterium]|nr:sensor histidine kinase [Symbiobacteriaceae bacterium]